MTDAFYQFRFKKGFETQKELKQSQNNSQDINPIWLSMHDAENNKHNLSAIAVTLKKKKETCNGIEVADVSEHCSKVQEKKISCPLPQFIILELFF